jgi:hypothetical protein
MGIGVPTGRVEDAFLVEVTDTLPNEPIKYVSLSVILEGRGGFLPAKLEQSEIDDMQRHAIQYGAEILLLERVDMGRRRAFYAFGAKRVEGEGTERQMQTCRHPHAQAALSRAVQATSRCLMSEQKRRHGLQGDLQIIFQVDGFGDVYRAVATPDSSRDTRVQGCGLDAVVTRNFGAHGDVLCQMALNIEH